MSHPYREEPILVIPKIRRVLPTWLVALSSMVWFGVGYGVGFSKTPRVEVVAQPGSCLDAVRDYSVSDDSYSHSTDYGCVHP